VNCLSLSPCGSADLSSHGSVAWGLQRGKVESLLWSLARRCGLSGFAPIRPHVDLFCWLSLLRPTKERPYDLLGPWAFREVFYSFSGPGGYLSPTQTTPQLLFQVDLDELDEEEAPCTVLRNMSTSVHDAYISTRSTIILHEGVSTRRLFREDTSDAGLGICRPPKMHLHDAELKRGEDFG
jgi:hypothetical protein